MESVDDTTWKKFFTKTGLLLFYYNTETHEHKWPNWTADDVSECETIQSADIFCKNDWMGFLSKSNDLLFYYNKKTFVHKWPDFSVECSIDNSLPAEGKPWYRLDVGTQTDFQQELRHDNTSDTNRLKAYVSAQHDTDSSLQRDGTFTNNKKNNEEKMDVVKTGAESSSTKEPYQSLNETPDSNDILDDCLIKNETRGIDKQGNTSRTNENCLQRDVTCTPLQNPIENKSTSENKNTSKESLQQCSDVTPLESIVSHKFPPKVSADDEGVMTSTNIEKLYNKKRALCDVTHLENPLLTKSPTHNNVMTKYANEDDATMTLISQQCDDGISSLAERPSDINNFPSTKDEYNNDDVSMTYKGSTSSLKPLEVTQTHTGNASDDNDVTMTSIDQINNAAFTKKTSEALITDNFADVTVYDDTMTSSDHPPFKMTSLTKLPSEFPTNEFSIDANGAIKVDTRTSKDNKSVGATSSKKIHLEISTENPENTNCAIAPSDQQCTDIALSAKPSEMVATEISADANSDTMTSKDQQRTDASSITLNQSDAFKSESRVNDVSRKKPRDRPYKCNICGKTFDRGTRFDIHARTHAKRGNKCYLCGLMFPTKASLFGHMKTHHKPQTYECKTCGKCFPKADELESHQCSHDGSKPFRCEFCGKSFMQRNNLVRHLRIVHGKTE